mgnify:CR=1 FL=1|jgi:hypothetical protein
MTMSKVDRVVNRNGELTGKHHFYGTGSDKWQPWNWKK